jgi:nucleotide-binding universal stress UspA family protein
MVPGRPAAYREWWENGDVPGEVGAVGDLLRILVATDNSDLAPPVYVEASRLAAALGGELVFGHIADPAEYEAIRLDTAMPLDHYFDNLRANIRYEFRGATGIAESTPLRVEIRLRERTVARDLLDLAERLRAGLIVIWTHGRTGLRRALMGSVAEEVLRHAQCPVVVVPQAMLKAAIKERVAVAAVGEGNA